jgi:catechol 2,3-dioxygenase-like lactoylglutathione lyase family enzyme
MEGTMLASGIMAGFVLTNDYDQARAFYVGKLGFEFISLDRFALVVKVGGHHIRIGKVPGFTPQQSTVLGWEVADIEAVVAWLAERGVATEKYPFVQDKDRGVWTTPDGSKVAWFKDPDGNVLSVSQH